MSIWPLAYQRHAPALRAFLARRVRGGEEAEDLCQETFVRAIQAEDSLRDPEKLRAYLFRIARNLLSNERRRPRLLRSETELAERIPLEETAAARSPSPEDEAAAAVLQERIRRITRTMPPEQRRAFELAVLQRRPYAEIARQTGWSLAKVKISVHRARRRVIETLGDELDPIARNPKGAGRRIGTRRPDDERRTTR